MDLSHHAIQLFEREELDTVVPMEDGRANVVGFFKLQNNELYIRVVQVTRANPFVHHRKEATPFGTREYGVGR